MPHKITMENHKENFKFDECLPDSYNNIVACDHCDKWFHHKSVNYVIANLGDWLCRDCYIVGLYIVLF